jgi:flavin reductase (DIM6/NTAB) family NADH-FMN oxidoreductase RutF
MTTGLTFDSERFRHVLGHFPTGVAVVTAIDDTGSPAGMAVGSFTSVSLDPPLVGFLPDKTSTTFPRISTANSFCINVLSSEQEDVCRAFSVKGGDKFGSLQWRPAPSGAPVLDQVLAWIDCRIETVHEAGDHYIVIGRVLDLDIGLSPGSSPLLFFRGGYAQLGLTPTRPATPSTATSPDAWPSTVPASG